MMENLYFFLEVLIAGLLSGTMYSLVALGFVLIYKASGIFNFAQGTMVLFAALTFVGVMQLGVRRCLRLPLRSPSWSCWHLPWSASYSGTW